MTMSEPILLAIEVFIVKLPYWGKTILRMPFISCACADCV